MALGFVGAAIALAVLIESVILIEGPVEPTWAVLALPTLALLYAATGLGAWWRRPSNRVGAILVLGACFWLLAGLVNTGVPVFVAIGQLTATLPYALIVNLVLVYPSGRAGTHPARAVIAFAYFTTTVLQLPLLLFAPGDGGDPLLITDRPDLFDAARWLQRGCGMAIVAASAIIVISRLRSTTPSARRVLAPLAIYGLGVVVLIPVSGSIIGPATGMDPLTLFTIQVIGLAGVPIAFALGVLRGGFARTGEIVELGAWFGTEPEPAQLTEALARTLGDPTVEVAFWLDDKHHYVDAGGAVVELPQPGTGRRAELIGLGRRHVGAIVHDPSLTVEPELVHTAGQVLAIAVDRQRLIAQLLSSREALRESRSRLVEAADDERRRIAHDLHDSLQSRLVVLAIRAQHLANQLTLDRRADAEQLRAGLDAAIGELRDVVQGVMPSLLIERGLVAAAEELVDRMPIPTNLLTGPAVPPLAPSIESAAFFVVAEGLANGLKHSQAGHMSVRLDVVDHELVIEVADDGIGGAAASGRGTGLRGIEDRVDVLGGRLSVHSPPGGGTTMLVQVPCGS